jgi:hypothetical protein
MAADDGSATETVGTRNVIRGEYGIVGGPLAAVELAKMKPRAPLLHPRRTPKSGYDNRPILAQPGVRCRQGTPRGLASRQ